MSRGSGTTQGDRRRNGETGWASSGPGAREGVIGIDLAEEKPAVGNLRGGPGAGSRGARADALASSQPLATAR